MVVKPYGKMVESKLDLENMKEDFETSERSGLSFRQERPRYHGQFSGSVRTDVWARYFENGRLQATGTYHGKRSGLERGGKAGVAGTISRRETCQRLAD